MCIFRWGFPEKRRRIFLRFRMKDIQSIRIEVKEGIYPRCILYMEIKGHGAIPLTRAERTGRTLEESISCHFQLTNPLNQLAEDYKWIIFFQVASLFV